MTARSRCFLPTGQRGAATALVAVLAGLVALLLALIAAWFGVVQAQKQAASAADLAALAAADAARGLISAEPCSMAQQVMARNQAELVACDLEISGDIVRVTAAVPLPGALQPLGPARAHARAGPPAP